MYIDGLKLAEHVCYVEELVVRQGKDIVVQIAGTGDDAAEVAVGVALGSRRNVFIQGGDYAGNKCCMSAGHQTCGGSMDSRRIEFGCYDRWLVWAGDIQHPGLDDRDDYRAWVADLLQNSPSPVEPGIAVRGAPSAL